MKLAVYGSLLAVLLGACVGKDPVLNAPSTSSSSPASSIDHSSVATSSVAISSTPISSTPISSTPSSSVSSSLVQSSSVISNTAPTVNWVSPEANYTVIDGLAAVMIEANVVDSEDNVSSVTLSINGQKQAMLTGSPYRWPASLIESLSVGEHALTIEATDEAGASTVVERTITVNPSQNVLPTVTFVNPMADDLLPHQSSLDVRVNAADVDGDIISAILYVNSQQVAEITQAPFEWPARLLPALNQLEEGLYTLKVVVTDNRGDTAEAQISVTVSEPNDFPVVDFVSPANALVLAAGAQIDVIADASDSDGQIAEVILSINGIDIGAPDKTTPYEWFATRNAELKDIPTGEYTLRLTAVDDKGGKAHVERQLTITNDADTAAGDPARGQVQYFQNCLECHGQFGEGTSRAKAIMPLKASYTKNGKSYSLFSLIDELMPDGYVSACADQCAKNVASYMKEGLTAAAQEKNTLSAGDIQTGKVEFELHCAKCHGNDGLGGDEDVVLFPVRSGDDYALSTFYFYAKVSLWSLIDLGMPYGPTGYPEGYAEKCSGQCAADVISYIKDLESKLTEQELLQVQIAAGKKQYATYCAGCHNNDGRRRGIIPLTNAERNNDSLDDSDKLFKYNRDAMPPSDPQSCGDQCSKDITVYIRAVLDQ
ncbi:Ig-like domain-containing protein [Marinagarivorans algicola]|uniref:Ig-like domain-containing protein n=1 Tax=Marinagarivorans algicola TaxID=1513270 RepID=UPI0006B974AB|nr:Ig-like domain-containing protein [Marinagarivorans algicola]